MSIAESLKSAEQAAASRVAEYAAAMDAMPDGTILQSGRREFKKVCVAGDVFWEFSIKGRYKSHLTSGQAFIEMGTVGFNSAK